MVPVYLGEIETVTVQLRAPTPSTLSSPGDGDLCAAGRAAAGAPAARGRSGVRAGLGSADILGEQAVPGGVGRVGPRGGVRGVRRVQRAVCTVCLADGAGDERPAAGRESEWLKSTLCVCGCVESQVEYKSKGTYF